MKYYVAFILFTSFYLTTFAQKQNHLVLQHSKNPNRFKELLLDEFYKIKLTDTIIDSKIVKFNDSTLTIVKIVKTEIDTIYEFGKYGEFETPGKIYYKDTLAIKFSDIQYIKIRRFKNKDFLYYPFYIGILSTVYLIFISTDQHDIESIVFAASVSAISWTLFIIGTSKKKYDTIDKWIIKTKE